MSRTVPPHRFGRATTSDPRPEPLNQLLAIHPYPLSLVCQLFRESRACASPRIEKYNCGTRSRAYGYNPLRGACVAVLGLVKLRCELATAAATKAIRLGHPSYVWRRGQDRRLAFIRQYVELRAKRILDVGCGLGMYVTQFRQFSDDVYGVDIDPDKINRASAWLPNLRVSPAE